MNIIEAAKILDYKQCSINQCYESDICFDCEKPTYYPYTFFCDITGELYCNKCVIKEAEEIAKENPEDE